MYVLVFFEIILYYSYIFIALLKITKNKKAKHSKIKLQILAHSN